jgi:hypothetical protein
VLTPRAVGLLPVCLTMKPVGEPDALIGHVRFDERGWETERCRMAQATAPILDSTIATFRCDSPPWSLLEGIADMNGRVASAKNVEIDPERKLNAPRSGMVTPASPR